MWNVTRHHTNKKVRVELGRLFHLMPSRMVVVGFGECVRRVDSALTALGEHSEPKLKGARLRRLSFEPSSYAWPYVSTRVRVATFNDRRSGCLESWSIQRFPDDDSRLFNKAMFSPANVRFINFF